MFGSMWGEKITFVKSSLWEVRLNHQSDLFPVFRWNDMSYFAYACKTEGKNDISHLISETA